MRVSASSCVIVLVVLWCTWINAVVANEENTAVTILNSENFDLVQSGSWFVKFYAPWCGHCKNLAPIWEQLAVASTDPRIAKVNCDDESSLCRLMGVTGYPTLKYFRDGKARAYNGGRSKPELASYIQKMQRPPVARISSGSELAGIVSNPNQVSFFLADADTRTHTKEVFQAAASEHLDLDSTKFYEIPEEFHGDFGGIDTIPTIVVVKDNTKIKYPGSIAKDDEVQKWIADMRLPFVSPLSGSNFAVLTNSGKPLVVGAVDPSDHSATSKLKANLLEVAKTDNRYVFCWVDGVQFASWVENFGIKERSQLPDVFVFDEPNEMHYEDPSMTTTVAEIQSLLNRIASGQVDPVTHTSVFQRYLNKFMRWVEENLIIAAVGFVVITVGLFATCIFCLGTGGDSTDIKKD